MTKRRRSKRQYRIYFTRYNLTMDSVMYIPNGARDSWSSANPILSNEKEFFDVVIEKMINGEWQ